MKISQIIALLAATLPVAAGPSLAASASQNWSTDCARCHGPDGSGHTLIGRRLHVKDKTDSIVQAGFTNDAMFAAIQDGIKAPGERRTHGPSIRLTFVTTTGRVVTVCLQDRMRAYKNELSGAEIHDLVAYIRQMKK